MRISRRTLLVGMCPALTAAKRRLPVPVGLQLYSLRYLAAKDVAAMLALVRKLGFEEVETSDFYGRNAAEFRKMLDAEGLKATSMMALYERLGSEIEAVIEDARALGAGYVVCPVIPYRSRLTAAEIRRAAEDFNRWGEKLAGAGLKFCYHAHGIEFGSSPEGTLFDTLAGLLDAKYANFEMDIFWIFFARQDPVKLLHKYPGRFRLMHLKDVRKGVKLGRLPSEVQEEESVPLGQGMIDIPAVLKAAKETGVEHYYLEDEAPNADRQIPESLRYLESIRL